MIKRIILMGLIIPTLYSQDIVYPWMSQWNRIAQNNVELYTDHCQEVLESTSEKIKDLLLQQAGARIPKGHVFNIQLQEILKNNTVQLVRKAKTFADKIRSEAQNTFDHKINHRIHHTLKPISAHSTKITRPDRKVLSNHYNKHTK